MNRTVRYCARDLAGRLFFTHHEELDVEIGNEHKAYQRGLQNFRIGLQDGEWNAWLIHRKMLPADEPVLFPDICHWTLQVYDAYTGKLLGTTQVTHERHYRLHA